MCPARPVRLPRQPGQRFREGDTVGWESGDAGTLVAGAVVEVVPPGGRPASSVKVLTLRDHESYIVEGQLYTRGGVQNMPARFWPRVGGLFPVQMPDPVTT